MGEVGMEQQNVVTFRLATGVVEGSAMTIDYEVYVDSGLAAMPRSSSSVSCLLFLVPSSFPCRKP